MLEKYFASMVLFQEEFFIRRLINSSTLSEMIIYDESQFANDFPTVVNPIGTAENWDFFATQKWQWRIFIWI